MRRLEDLAGSCNHDNGHNVVNRLTGINGNLIGIKKCPFEYPGNGVVIAMRVTVLFTILSLTPAAPISEEREQISERLPTLSIQSSKEYFKHACEKWENGKPSFIPRSIACDERNTDLSGGRCRPDILLAGLPKCGTTSLYNALVSHPSRSIVRPRTKEPDFFVTNRDVVVTPNFGYKFNDTKMVETYLASLWGRQPINTFTGKYLIDSQPRILQGGKRTAAVAAVLCPETKILVVSCDPTRRAHTHYSYRALGHGLFSWQSKIYEGTTFDQTVQKQLDEVPDVIRRLPVLYEAAKNAVGHEKKDIEETILIAEREAAEVVDSEDSSGITTFVTLGLYALSLRPWLDRFPSSSIHVINLEDYAQDPNGVMRGIESFLQLETRSSTATRQHLHMKLNVNSKKSPFSEATLEKLREFYRPFNQRLEHVVRQETPAFSTSNWRGEDMS
eukprot:m.261591 g.261591  ORF g.261591 m.261591 type:complete len:445 (-) comp42468_c0_seq1:162-1496(-)